MSVYIKWVRYPKTSSSPKVPISVCVENDSDREFLGTIILEVGSQIVASKDIDLPPHSSTVQTFTVYLVPGRVNNVNVLLFDSSKMIVIDQKMAQILVKPQGTGSTPVEIEVIDYTRRTEIGGRIDIVIKETNEDVNPHEVTIRIVGEGRVLSTARTYLAPGQSTVVVSTIWAPMVPGVYMYIIDAYLDNLKNPFYQEAIEVAVVSPKASRGASTATNEVVRKRVTSRIAAMIGLGAAVALLIWFVSRSK